MIEAFKAGDYNRKELVCPEHKVRKLEQENRELRMCLMEVSIDLMNPVFDRRAESYKKAKKILERKEV